MVNKTPQDADNPQKETKVLSPQDLKNVHGIEYVTITYPDGGHSFSRHVNDEPDGFEFHAFPGGLATRIENKNGACAVFTAMKNGKELSFSQQSLEIVQPADGKLADDMTDSVNCLPGATPQDIKRKLYHEAALHALAMEEAGHTLPEDMPRSAGNSPSPI